MKFTYPVTCIYFFIISHDKSTSAMPPLVGPFGSGGVLQGFRQQAQFGEGIRDWFINMKDRIFGNSHSPNISTLVNQAKGDYNHQKKMIEGFWLDLTQLSFDPDRDWGFHLGPWFFIKKSNDNSNTDSVNLPRPEPKITDTSKTVWDRYDFGKDGSWTELIPTVITHNNREITTSGIEENTTLNNDSNKNGVLNEKDNETYDPSTSDESAEVISPGN